MKKKKNYREPVNFTRVSIYLTPGMINDVEQAITEQSEPNQPRVSITQFIRTAIAEKLARPIEAPATAQAKPLTTPVFGH